MAPSKRHRQFAGLKPRPQAHVLSVQQTTIKASQGPLPPPEDLARYDQALPGAAGRILQMAEGNQQHRHVLEKAALQNEIESGKRGQTFGAIVAVAGIGGGTLIAIFGSVAVGAGLSGGTIGAVAVAYFGSLYSRRKEREAKARWMSGVEDQPK